MKHNAKKTLDCMFKSLLYRNLSVPIHIKYILIKWVKDSITIVDRYDASKEQRIRPYMDHIHLLHDVSLRNPHSLALDV